MPDKCPHCGAAYFRDARPDGVDADGLQKPVRRSAHAVACYICPECGENEIDALRRQLAEAKTEVAHLRRKLALFDLTSERNYGDGDSNALWNRIDDFREGQRKRLSLDDQHELAEWWAELHSALMELDDKLAEAQDARDAAEAAHAKEYDHA